MSAEQKKRLETILSSKLETEITVEETIDKEIVAGIVIGARQVRRGLVVGVRRSRLARRRKLVIRSAHSRLVLLIA